VGTPHSHPQQEDGMGAEEGGRSSGKVSPLVYVPDLGGFVYKMRVVASCNEGNGKVSLDRLQRVRTNVKSTADVDSAGDIGLFDNVALHFVENGGVHKWYIAQVLVMTKIFPTGRKEYHLPVAIDDAELAETLELTVKYYKSVNRENRLFIHGGYEGQEAKPVLLQSVLMRVCTLTRRDNGQFELGENEVNILEEFVRNANNKREVRRRVRRANVANEEHTARTERRESQIAVGTSSRGRRTSSLHPGLMLGEV
jgi:hypothetical protein